MDSKQDIAKGSPSYAPNSKKADEILYCSFNQDQGCFAAGTQSGFRIYNTKPFRDQFIRSKH